MCINDRPDIKQNTQWLKTSHNPRIKPHNKVDPGPDTGMIGLFARLEMTPLCSVGLDPEFWEPGQSKHTTKLACVRMLLAVSDSASATT